MTTLQPAADQYGLLKTPATSERGRPSVPRPSDVPLPIVPVNTCNSSAPAQPCAVLSTNQPLRVASRSTPSALPLAGVSMPPAYVLSPDAFGPACQVALLRVC